MPCLGDSPRDYRIRVLLLDDSEHIVDTKSTAKGQLVLERVCAHLNITEKDFFGVRYLDATNQTHWLEPTKSLGSQLKNGDQHTVYFGVKFYAADPCKLHEEVTRYQCFLQVKRDILQGRLPVAFDISAELAAYAVQSELGDFDPKRHSLGYISEFRFVPNQTEELENRIAQLHRAIVGQVPAIAEYRYLDKAKWLEMYGVDLHPVQGEGSVEYFVGLTPTGVVVYRNKSKVGNYFWPRITKVTFKGKVFMVRVKDKNNDENTYAFECTTKPACKHLWKCCVEHHAFFRLSQANSSYSAAHKLLSLGSKNRYSARSERQILADSTNTASQVVRMPSKRHQRRPSSDGGQLASNQMGQDMDGPVTTVVTPEPVKTPSEQRKMGDPAAAPKSPRSTRSAPWENGHHRKGGLYTTGRESPLSVRSEKMMFPAHRRGHSGSESESGHHRKRHNRAASDYDSDGSSRRHRRRRHRQGHEAGSEGESESGYTGHRHRHRHSRRSSENLNEGKWKDTRPPREGAGSVASMPGSEASHHSHHSKRSRRRRSRSPGNRRPPEELAQHFRYVEADPALSQDQLRDIPYMKVETRQKSPHTRLRNKSPRRRSYGETSEKGGENQLPAEEPPPPYTTTSQYTAPNSRQTYTGMPYRGTGEVVDVRPPQSAFKNEAQTAPIVKTKPVAMQYTATGGQHQQQPARLPDRNMEQSRYPNRTEQVSHHHIQPQFNHSPHTSQHSYPWAPSGDHSAHHKSHHSANVSDPYHCYFAHEQRHLSNSMSGSPQAPPPSYKSLNNTPLYIEQASSEPRSLPGMHPGLMGNMMSPSTNQQSPYPSAFKPATPSSMTGKLPPNSYASPLNKMAVNQNNNNNNNKNNVNNSYTQSSNHIKRDMMTEL